MDESSYCQRTDWNWHPCGDPPLIEHFECGCGTSVFAICPDPAEKLKHYTPHAPRAELVVEGGHYRCASCGSSEIERYDFEGKTQVYEGGKKIGSQG